MDQFTTKQMDMDALRIIELDIILFGKCGSNYGGGRDTTAMQEIMHIRQKYTDADCPHTIIYPRYARDYCSPLIMIYRCRLCTHIYGFRSDFPAESIEVDLWTDEI